MRDAELSAHGLGYTASAFADVADVELSCVSFPRFVLLHCCERAGDADSALVLSFLGSDDFHVFSSVL